MNQKVKIAIGAAAFALLIAAAVLAYNALRSSAGPEILLAEQPGSIATPGAKSEAAEPEETSESAETSEPAETAPQEPERIKAPDFTVEDADGNSVKLSEMEGKPVVVNFWASWCPPCKAEMPGFDSLYAELGSEVTFMMVNLTDGQRETKETGMNYIAGEGYTFPVYYDVDQEAAYTYGIRSIPTTIFIDSEGYIVTGAQGQLDVETLRYGISLIQDGAGEGSAES